MKNYKNIEDLFTDNLKNLEVNPTEKVWKGVRSNLWYSDIQNIFRNYTIQPANTVWRKIAFLLWFKSFITFSPKTFNLYYVITIGIAGLSAFYGMNEPSASGFKLNEIEIHSINWKAVNNQDNGIDILKPNNVTVENSINQTAGETTDANKTLIAQYVDKSDSQNGKNRNLHEPLILSDENENNSRITDRSSISFLTKRSSLLSNEYSEASFESRIIPEFNTKKWHWSIEAFVMPTSSNAVYKVKADEFSTFNDKYAKNTIPTNNLSGGLLLQASHLNVSFQTGLLLSTYKDRPEYQVSSFSFDTAYVTQIIPNGFYNYYTVQVLDLDYYLQTGDSLWINVIDSTFISTNDTVVQQQITAHTTKTQKKTLNSYTYVELPILAGYTFSQGKINMTVRGGILIGLLTSARGEIPSPYSEYGTVEIDQNAVCRKVMLSGMAGLELAYDVTKHLSFVTAPVYRFNLSSVYKKSYMVDQRFRSFGIKFGLKYNF